MSAAQPSRTPPILTYCPYGHRLGPYRALIGWHFCQCPPALAQYRGHRTVQCLACDEAGLRTIAYDPYHVRSAEEIELELQRLRFSRDMAREGIAQRQNDVPPRLAEQAARLEQGVAELERLVEARRRRTDGDGRPLNIT